MITKTLIGIMLGASLGGIAGYFMKAAGGTCPLTCNPIGGMITGGLAGFLIVTAILDRKTVSYSENVAEVSNEVQFNNAVAGGGLMLVDFYAEWCGPCRMLKPVINSIAEQYKGRLRVMAVNIDKNTELAGRYGVKGIPDVRLFKDGKVVDKIAGYHKENYYRDRIEMLLEETAPEAE